jgi:type IV pilus assembly protein PilA
LIELLLVLFTIGLLAAIAIPSFLGQSPKAQDADAKAAVRTAQTAIEAYRTDHIDYCASTAALIAIEATLSAASGLAIPTCGANSYQVRVTSKAAAATVYVVSYASGSTTRTCDTPGRNGCRADGTW